LFSDRLPKKLGASMTLQNGVDKLEFGWGIHIIEGGDAVGGAVGCLLSSSKSVERFLGSTAVLVICGCNWNWRLNG
jgi:hypothetical protein